MIYTVRYGEISTKGKNFIKFEKALIRNIKIKLINAQINYKKIESREKKIYIYFDEDEEKKNKIDNILSKTFGISWFGEVFESEKEKEKIKEALLLEAQKKNLNNKRVKIEVKRGDKSLPFTSLDFEKEIGSMLKNNLNCKIDQKNPEIIITVDILRANKAFFTFEKKEGLDGLPIGCSGKGIVLFSGGIDSPVAAWMMMKRGLELVFLHVIADYSDYNKIEKFINYFKELQGKVKFYLVPYTYFYKSALAIEKEYELIMFKYFIFKLGEKVAENEGAQVLISGDSLGQVASQTLNNIIATTYDIKLPILRPLIGMNKKEIIEMAQKIKTYEISTIKHKDCCSILSKQATTYAKPEKVNSISQLINIDKIINESIENSEIKEY